MATEELSQLIHLPIRNRLVAPPPEDTPDKETIDPQEPNLTCSQYPEETKTHTQVVRVENAMVQYMARRLDCTTSVANTLNNGIHDIHFGLQMTLKRSNHVASI
jgi:hypothetical protein